jgi:hypothetical protein
LPLRRTSSAILLAENANCENGVHPPAAPCVLTKGEYTDVLPHMNRRLRCNADFFTFLC